MSTSTFSSAGPALAAKRPLQAIEVVKIATEIPAVAPFRNHRPSSRHWWALLSVAAWLALWWLATELRWVPPLFLPPPEAVIKAFDQAWRGHIQGGDALWVHAQWSSVRVLGAFTLAVMTAVPVGIAMGVNRWAQVVLDPILEFYRPLPPLAYLPLVVIWLGIDEASKWLLIYLACFAPMALAARAGTRNASAEQINALRSLGATRWQLLCHAVVPAALPDILVGLRIAMGFAWTTLVAAEMVAATQGLGQMVLNASNFLRTDIVVMGIFVIGAIALLLDGLLRRLEHWLLPWHGR
ncbi:MAG: ABC transporter permease subunit [Comamonas sp.]|jgi:taurine transport system permease protein|nr:ABC transporter permease subunit [Comamonas sp.]